jgi:hypothetical protein
MKMSQEIVAATANQKIVRWMRVMKEFSIKTLMQS